MFKQSIEDIRIEVEDKLREIFEQFINSSKSKYSESFLQNINEVKRMLLLPGAKRIRPALVFIGYQLYSNLSISEITDQSIKNDLLNLACGLEIFHTFALIHDDIIDQSLTRRNHPTIESVYRDFFESNYGGGNTANLHHAVGATILAGDLALSIADSLISQISNESVRKYYYEMQLELIAGQIDDCYGVGLCDLDNLTEDKILNMMKAKSGNYSISRPFSLGLIMHDSNENNLSTQSLFKICEKIGLIFQLTDDIIGIFGDEKITGKSSKIDIIEGKKTLLILQVYNKSSTVDKLRIRSILGDPEVKNDDITWLKWQIKNTKVFDNLMNYCRDLSEEINTELDKIHKSTQLGKNSEYAITFLKEFTNYLLKREK